MGWAINGLGCLMNKLWGTVAIFLSVAYCGFIFLFFHSPLVTAVSILLCLFFILGGYFEKRRNEKLINAITDDISDNLELLFNNDYQNVNALDLLDETLISKINQKIVRIAEVLKIATEKSTTEKKVLEGFISDISHQVKTPMTNLKLLHETIQDRDLPEQTRNELLKLMGTQLEKLEFLLSFMVKVSRLEAGLIQLKKQPENLFDTLAEALSDITVPAEKKQIQITVNCPEEYRLNHDLKWTAEALFNVLENAVKYSPDHSFITVDVKRCEMYTRITITDSGKGIPEVHYGKIFQRFYREEENQEIEGIGIGLYLAREIIEKQNGYIMVRSVVGEGSTFSVFLPNAF